MLPGTSLSCLLRYPRAKVHRRVHLLHQPVVQSLQVDIEVKGETHSVKWVARGPDMANEERRRQGQRSWQRGRFDGDSDEDDHRGVFIHAAPLSGAPLFGRRILFLRAIPLLPSTKCFLLLWRSLLLLIGALPAPKQWASELPIQIVLLPAAVPCTSACR